VNLQKLEFKISSDEIEELKKWFRKPIKLRLGNITLGNYVIDYMFVSPHWKRRSNEKRSVILDLEEVG
jgi:hypothetical protein